MLSSGFAIFMLFQLFPPHAAVTRTTIIPNHRAVSIPGGIAIFICLYDPNAENLQWLVNGTQLENFNLTNITLNTDDPGIQDLIFNHIPQDFNDTTIQCRAIGRDGTFSSSNSVKLFVQGLLTAVGSLDITVVNFTILYLNWTAPFFIDTPNNPARISFCVSINVTSSTSTSTNTTCGITDSEFHFSLPHGRVCEDYVLIVTPVNRVGNGTSTTVEYPQALIPPEAIDDDLQQEGSNINGVYIYRIVMSAPVCEACLIFKDLNDAEIITKEDLINDLTIASSTIVFTSEQLRKNRFYNVTITASNVNGSATSNTRISTHGIANVTVHQNSNGINITVNYFKHSQIRGAYLSFILTRDDGSIDFNNSTHLFLDRDSSHNYLLPVSLLFGGQYHLYAYDIHNHGILMAGVEYPASVNQFFVGRNPEFNRTASTDIEDCNVFTATDVIGVSAICTFSSGSLATGFQMIARSKLEEVERLLINHTFDHFTPVTIKVEENKTYFISIFPIRRRDGIIVDSVTIYSTVISTDYIYFRRANQSTSTITNQTTVNQLTAITIGVGIAVFFILVLLLVGTILLLHKQCSKSKSLQDPRQPSESSAQIYEEIADPTAYSCMQCPAYAATSEVIHHDHEYEGIKIPTSSHTNFYELTECSAYGVAALA